MDNVKTMALREVRGRTTCDERAFVPGASAIPAPRRAALRIVGHGKERRPAGPHFASSPTARVVDGRGHRRGLDGPSMPGPRKNRTPVFGSPPGRHQRRTVGDSFRRGQGRNLPEGQRGDTSRKESPTGPCSGQAGMEVRPCSAHAGMEVRPCSAQASNVRIKLTRNRPPHTNHPGANQAGMKPPATLPSPARPPISATIGR